MATQRMLTWGYRAFLSIALLLFIGVFVYGGTLRGEPGRGPGGEAVEFVSANEMQILLLMFTGVIACFLIGVSKLVSFVAFGAKEAAEAVGEFVDEVKATYGAASDASSAPPAAMRPPEFRQQTFLPEPLEPGPRPGSTEGRFLTQ